MTQREAAASEERPRTGPGRPRSPLADEAIIEAAIELLAQVGYAGFTIHEVIARAGVSSATLYRRWSNKNELITAALSSLGPDPVAIDTGSFDADLAAFVDYLGGVLARRNDLAAAWSTAVADSELHEAVVRIFVKPRKAMLAGARAGCGIGVDRTLQQGRLRQFQARLTGSAPGSGARRTSTAAVPSAFCESGTM